MPYSLSVVSGKYCVNKKTPGGLQQMKCYPDRQSALDYLRALYANVPDAKSGA